MRSLYCPLWVIWFCCAEVVAHDHDSSFCAEELSSRLAKLAELAARPTFASDPRYDDAVDAMNVAMVEVGLDHENCRKGSRNCGTPEGSSSRQARQLRFYKDLASHPCVETICEIGFNAGVSYFDFIINLRYV